MGLSLRHGKSLHVQGMESPDVGRQEVLAQEARQLAQEARQLAQEARKLAQEARQEVPAQEARQEGKAL